MEASPVDCPAQSIAVWNLHVYHFRMRSKAVAWIVPLMIAVAGLMAMVLLVRSLDPVWIFAMAAGLMLFVATFINMEFTLHLVILSMLLSPEIVLARLGGGGFHNELTIRLEDVLLIFMGMAWLSRVAIFKEVTAWRRSPLNGPLAAFVGACALSTVVGYMEGKVSAAVGFFYNLKLIEFAFTYYMTLQVVEDYGAVRRLIRTVIATSVLVCLYGLYQIPTGERVSAPFEGEVGEPNTFGGYLLLMMGLALGLFATRQGYWKKSAFAFLILLYTTVLIYTQSRASWLGLLPLALGFVVIFPRRIVAIYAFLGVVLVAAILLPGSAKDVVMSRIEQTIDPKGERYETAIGIEVDTSTGVRLQQWSNSFRMWLASPILGTGVSTFGADAMYPRVLVETGAVGLGMFLWLIGRLLRVAAGSWRVVRGHPQYAGIGLGYFCAFFALLGHGIAAAPFWIVRVMEPFWLLTAIAVSLPRLMESAEAVADGEPAPAALHPATEGRP